MDLETFHLVAGCLLSAGISFLAGIYVGAIWFPEIVPPPSPEKDFDHDTIHT